MPRFIAMLGLVGRPMIFASSTAVPFGGYQQVSTWGSIAALPVLGWEMSLATWLIVKGFKSSPLATDDVWHLAVDGTRSAA